MTDVFISYSSTDRAWAAKVNDELGRRGFTVFFDRDRLDVGLPWEPQLRDAIKAAQHLVVLWSVAAKDSAWVSREISEFEARHDSDRETTHRLIFVKLDATPCAYASIQSVEEFRDAGAYAAGADKASDTLWREAFERVRKAISGEETGHPIHLAVLTLTEGELDDLHDTAWDEIQSQLGIDRVTLSKRYGPTRGDWRPLDGRLTIASMLSDLRDRINAEAKAVHPGLRFRWEPLPDVFWNDIDSARQHAGRFASAQLSVLVIDPVATYLRSVYQRMNYLESWTRSHTAVFVLPPLPFDPVYQRLLTWLGQLGAPYFDPYFHPGLPPRVRLAAQCALPVNDDRELERVMLSTIGGFLLSTQSVTPSRYLKM